VPATFHSTGEVASRRQIVADRGRGDPAFAHGVTDLTEADHDIASGVEARGGRSLVGVLPCYFATAGATPAFRAAAPPRKQNLRMRIRPDREKLTRLEPISGQLFSSIP
jgi:hypothetical protein